MQGSHEHGGHRHSWWIMMLCIAPIVAIAVINVLGLQLSSVLLYAVILLCPLSHLLMMRGMREGDEDRHRHADDDVAAATEPSPTSSRR